MSDEELVEKMARKVHADRMKEEPAQYPIGFDDEHSVYTTAVLDLMRSALAVARPIIEREALEKAAKVVDIAYHQEPFGDDATITIADDPTKIAAAIRALMEQSK